MGQDRIEKSLQLVREKAVEKEVRDDQVVGAGGIPRQGIGMMQANALVVFGLANALFEKSEHGLAGVDNIRGQGGTGFEETGEKSPVSVSQHESMACAGEAGQLGGPAAGQVGPEAEVLKPAIGSCYAIEGDLWRAHRAKGSKAIGVSRAISAAMRRCKGEKRELRASRANRSALLTVAAR